MPFDIAGFLPTPEALLGKGVWGEVYDLGDGTVLKMARAVGGVGDGCAKLRKEEALGRLFGAGPGLSFALPRCLGAGVFDRHGFQSWMRSTKIEGRVGTVADSEPTWGAPLGQALRELHGFLDTSALRELAEPDPIFEDLASGPPISKEDRALAQLVQRLYAVVPAQRLRPIHGDFNISNIMLDGSRVSGVLDFAEFCLGFVEEDVVSLTAELPALTDSILEGYGRALEPTLLRLAAAKRALIGMMICRYRLHDAKEAQRNEEALYLALRETEKILGATADPGSN